MNATSLTVAGLIQRELPAARGGDHAAYGRIVAACQNTVTAVALAITRDVGASEDIAQEAFLSAWQHLERLHNPDSFLPWLRQIARNLARDHLRKHRERSLDGANAELALAMAADPGAQPMQELLQSEHEVAAAELIAALPEDSRETLLLFYREGQSSQQVAALLGLTDTTVRKRLSRARQQVRDELIRRFGEFARSSSPTAAFTAAVVAGLGLASKPTAAAVASAAGAATVGGATVGAAKIGGALVGKGLTGMLGLGSGFGAAMAVGAIGARLTRRHLLAYADTLEERDQILFRYRVYFCVTPLLMIATFGVMLWMSSFELTMAATLFTEVVSLWTLLAIRRDLLPLITRDFARDRAGARGRYRAYDFSYGPTAIVVSGFFYILSMGMLHLAMHPGSAETAAVLAIIQG